MLPSRTPHPKGIALDTIGFNTHAHISIVLLPIITRLYTNYMPSLTPNPKGIALDSSSCDAVYAERSTQLLAAWSRQHRVHRPCNQPTSLGFAATIAISSALLCRYYFPCLKPLQVRPCRSMSPAGPKYKGNAGRQSGDEGGKTRMNIIIATCNNFTIGTSFSLPALRV